MKWILLREVGQRELLDQNKARTGPLSHYDVTMTERSAPYSLISVNSATTTYHFFTGSSALNY